MPNSRDPNSSTPLRRNICIAFGIFFIAVGVLILVSSTAETRRNAVLVALVFGGLGVDEIISALRGKRSLLSRIGPLP